jgi:deoxyribose-phosphate aldolase
MAKARPHVTAADTAAPVSNLPVKLPAPANRTSGHARNPGFDLNLEWLEGTEVNFSAVERRTATLLGRRTVKKQWQAAWLLKALTCIDLTTLNGDDTAGRVKRLCAKAKKPLRDDIAEALGVADRHITTGAVCVYHEMVETAVRELEGTGIPVAAVAAGFPHGMSPLKQRLAEIRASVAAGAKEIDIVITRGHVLTGNWQALYDEVKQMREACGDARLKSILATGELATLRNVAKASLVAMMAGSDFIKTSTGKENVNANLNVSLIMIRMIREFDEQTGYKIAYKPAGGISTAKDIMNYQFLMKEELGNPWLEPDLFRVGASSLLGDIERQLEHFITGRYSANNRHPMA